MGTRRVCLLVQMSKVYHGLQWELEVRRPQAPGNKEQWGLFTSYSQKKQATSLKCTKDGERNPPDRSTARYHIVTSHLVMYTTPLEPLPNKWKQ